VSGSDPDRPDGTDETDGAPGEPAPVRPRVDRKLLEFLVCPVTRGTLVYDAARQELVSKGANRAFPIHDGVPVLLLDAARVLDD
jgi:uncharacterized protein YbaR (Trm112 family)